MASFFKRDKTIRLNDMVLEKIKDGQFILKEYTGKQVAFTVPNTVVEIGEKAFISAEYLEKIIVPGTVKKIGENAFFNCYNLKEVILSEGLKEIGSSAFDGCGRLKEIALPSTLRKIGTEAFAVSGLESIVIPDMVTEIGSGAFSDCHKLKKVVLPKLLTMLETSTFFSCNRLEEITFGSSLLRIGLYAFGDCRSLEEIDIPGSVENLNMDVFVGSYRLKKLRCDYFYYNPERDDPEATMNPLLDSITRGLLGAYDQCGEQARQVALYLYEKRRGEVNYHAFRSDSPILRNSLMENRLITRQEALSLLNETEQAEMKAELLEYIRSFSDGEGVGDGYEI